MTIKFNLKRYACVRAIKVIFSVLAAFLFFVPISYGQTTASPTPPKLRLGDAAKPTRYTVELTIVPTDDTFAGAMDIDLELRAATSLLWLNAAEITVREARLDAGGQSLTAKPVAGDTEFLGFAFDRPVGPGPAKLHIAYQGKLSGKDSRGLFKQKEGDDWYISSHFEPIDARHAFPCFDEPSFKVPWQLALHVKKEHVALANTPILSESEEPNGMKRVQFAETKPLPSYLVALAVGPWEFVDAGKAGKKGTPVRIVTPRGKTGQAQYAARMTPEVLTRLENYFGTPYPYEKLDQIAVPQGGGAMENPGLVTYAQPILVVKPEEETIGHQRGFVGVCMHELAHQWFGDLVTMVWWDDLWLNEAFATWMAGKLVDQWKPEWDGKVNRAFSHSGAMSNDSLITARKIRQPIESKNDIANAFDGITYGKGAAVIDMFEAWVGPEKFQKGVQRYLAKHAWGNATAQDFLAAISAEAGRDIAPAFSTFLDQAGVPLVSVELQCGEGVPPKLALTQKRYLPTGSQGSAQQTWQIPVCVKYGVGTSEGRECMLMTGVTAEFKLSSAKGCPDWVLPNEGEVGYYRVLYRGDLLSRLLKDGGKRLTLPERVGVIGDVGALVRTGDVSAGEALNLVPGLLKDPNRHIISSTMGIVGSISNIVPDELRPNYARFIRKMYGPKARALGWQAKPNEDDDTRLLRLSLVSLVAGEGEDQALIAEAQKLARRWLEDRRAVDANMVDSVLRIAARNGDRALFDRFHAEAKKTQDRNDRGHLLRAMGSFRDPEIIKTALAIPLTDEFDTRESLGLLFSGMGEPNTRELPYNFVKQTFDALVAKLPRDFGAFLPNVGGGFCDEEHRADVEAFFKDRSTKYTGGPRNLAQTLERISLCSAFKRAQQPSVAAFLKKY